MYWPEPLSINYSKSQPLEAGSRLGHESAVAFSKEQVKPSMTLRTSISLIETVRHELGKGLPIRWISVCGRLQNKMTMMIIYARQQD